jgi:16S rRNA (guanine966-N2)-methyltransferase
MRIVAGERKGTRLAAPPGRATRPTSDRARETLFAILHDVAGARVLDAFAGSGALAFEALSRGAASAVLWDMAPAALRVVRENASLLRYADRCIIRHRDARRGLASARAAGETYDLVLLDPPYAMLQALQEPLEDHLPGLLAAGGRVVVERAAGEAPLRLPIPVSVERRVGSTALTVYADA